MQNKPVKAGELMPELIDVPTTLSIIDMEFLKAHAGWDTSPPSSLTIDEAIKIFVEGMELGQSIHQKAIKGAFNSNLELVLNKATDWFESLKSQNVPILAMFVKPESIYRFSVFGSPGRSY